MRQIWTFKKKQTVESVLSAAVHTATKFLNVEFHVINKTVTSTHDA
jgi:hypothetical protein